MLASLAAVAQSQTASQAFAVDLNAATKPFDNAVVTRCFGSSHAATAMRGEIPHASVMGSDVPFPRGWGPCTDLLP